MRRRIRRTYPDLAAFFRESGVSQAEFAERIKHSQSYVSKVRHRIIEPNLTDALLICREAGVPLESLIKQAETVSEA